MGKSFLSTATHVGKPIDCRCLSLAMEFYQLSTVEIQEISNDIIQWTTNKLHDNFVVNRYLNNKSVTRAKVLPQINYELQLGHAACYSEDGMVISPSVYNSKTYRSYMRNIQRGMYRSSKLNPYVSIDYRPLWESLFTCKDIELEQIKENILSIFREENRKLVTHYLLPDVHSFLAFFPYRNDPNCFYGSYTFSFSSFCLNSLNEDMARDLAQFALYLSQIYVKLNARVMLQPVVGPRRNPYLTIFGSNGNTDGSHKKTRYTDQEWYPTYYLPGIEWFNVISPLAQAHIPNIAIDIDDESIVTHRVYSGGITVESKKSILQFDISESLRMKQLVYPALYPGMMHFKLNSLLNEGLAKQTMSNFPRSNWAIIPVLENEIEIIGSHLVISSNNS